MRYLTTLALVIGFINADVTDAQDDIFPPGAKAKLVAQGAGEGPAWHPSVGLLFSGRGGIERISSQGKQSMFRKDAGSNGLLFDNQGRLVVCEPKRRRVTRMERGGKITVLTDKFEGKAYNQPNDLTVDSKGRIYFSDPKYGPRENLDIRDSKGKVVEGVYRIDPTGSVTRIITHEVDRPNGLLVTPDDRYLFVADNNNNENGAARRLYRFHLNADGTVDHKSRKLIFDWKGGRGPDGMAMDRKGRLYVAGGRNEPTTYESPIQFKGGVYVFSPAGDLLRFIHVPRDEVTNCTFGGKDLKTLYITAGGTLWAISATTAGYAPFARQGQAKGRKKGNRKKNKKKAAPKGPQPGKKLVYKTVGKVKLSVHVFEPAGHKPSDRRPAIVFFFGGGWVGGAPSQFYRHAQHLAERGVVAMAAEYRVRSRHQTTPFDCVADGKSAIRWIRANADKLGIDTNRVAAGGGSAGGHVAAATATVPGLDDTADDKTVSCRPDALVLFNPVYDNGPKGYGYERVKDRYKEISPLHNIKKGMPPAIVFLGTKDKLIPVATGEKFRDAMLKVGSRSELRLYEGAGHGFFNYGRDGSKHYKDTVEAMDKFLGSLGWFQAKAVKK